MGKGAGGCDDRPAFTFGSGTATTTEPSIPVAYQAAFDRVRAHRELYPINDMVTMGCPCLPGAESDRVRFRRMLKELAEMGYAVSSWEKEADDPDIIFSDGYPKGPHYTTDGTLQNYEYFRVAVKSLSGEIALGYNDEADDPNTDVINDVQNAMLRNGFYAVVNFEHRLIPTGMVAHPSRDGEYLSYDQDAPTPLRVLQAETGIILDIEGVEEVDIDGDDALLARYAAFYQSEELGYDHEKWAYTSLELHEAEQWQVAGIQAEHAGKWQKIGLNDQEAQEWLEAGLQSSQHATVAKYHKNDISVEQGLAMQAMKIPITQVGMYDNDEWQAVTDAIAASRALHNQDDGIYGLQYDLRCLRKDYTKMKKKLDPAAARKEFERRLAWIGAGFRTYREVYSWYGEHEYKLVAPWEGEWEGYSPQHAGIYREAGFDHPASDVSLTLAKKMIAWKASCSDQSDEWFDDLGTEMLRNFCEKNITAADVIDMQGRLDGKLQQAHAALVNGLTTDDLDEWKPFLSLRNSPAQYRRAGEFKQTGASIRQAIIFHHAGVEPEAFATVQTAFVEA